MGQHVSKFGKISAKLLLLGLDNAGKTSALRRLKIDDDFTTTPTIGFNVEEITPTKNITLTMFDVGGQEALRPLWKYHFQGTQGIIFVIDSSDVERIDDARKELFNVLEDKGLEKGVPTIIIANKQDLPNSMDESELVEKLKLKELKSNPWYVQRACAITGDGLTEGVTKMAQMVRSFQKSKKGGKR